MKILNFVIGGRTGDLIHNLMVVKSLCETNKSKANIFLSHNHGGDLFYKSLEETLNDLSPLINYQPYINSFKLYTDEPIQYNLNQWRNSSLFMKENWIKILTNLYSIPAPNDKWIEFNKIQDNRINNKIIIHRSDRRHNPNFPWENLIKNNDCLFVYTEKLELDFFPFKDMVESHHCSTFSELVSMINNGKFFIGNMSTPLSLAHALGKPRLAELYITDQAHYLGEEFFLNNYFYIGHSTYSYIDGVEKYIKL
jgi:hypothetical protein